MSISLLLFLVLGSAAAADKPSSDKGEALRVLKRSNITMSVSRPVLEKIITLLDNIGTHGRKNILFVNIHEARKLKKLYVRYLRETAKKGYLQEKETDVSRASPFRKMTNSFVRYLREAAIIEHAVIQALMADVNHPTKYKGSQKTSSNMKRNCTAVAVSRPCLDRKITPGRGSKNVLFVNILKARKLQEKETAAIIKQAVIQALKGGINCPTKYKGAQKTSGNVKKSYTAMAVSKPSLDKIITPGRGSKNVLFVNILKVRKLKKRKHQLS